MQLLRFLLFFGIAASVLGSIHVYLYRRLVRATTDSPVWRRRGKWAFGGMFALLFVSAPLASLWRNGTTQAMASAAWTWMGIAFLLASVVLLTELARLAAWLANRRGAASAVPAVAPEPAAAPGDAPVSPERRLFLSRMAAGGAVVAAGGMASYGVWRAYAPPEVTELSVVLPRLPRTLDGLAIVQVSDIHVSTLIQRRFMDEMVRRCNALKPDLVAVTGDLMDGTVEELGHHVAALQDLKTRFGTFFITGNHEYYSGDEVWCATLEKMGLTVLRNRHVSVGDAGGSFDLVGVDDWSANGPRRYDLDKAVAGRNPDRAAVLLAHQPRNFEKAVEKGIGLQLSGHTHGGQMFPGTLLIPLLWPQAAGHFTHKDSHLYVSRGTGFWGPPLRIGAAPEIVKIVLRAG